MAGSVHRFRRQITLRSARLMRANAGRPSPLFRRHRLRMLVQSLRNARKQFQGQQKRLQHQHGSAYRIPLRLRFRRAIATARAKLARRFR